MTEGKNTAEYQTFFRNQAEIADTIGDINGLIDRIVANLYAKRIVGKAVRDAADIRGPHVTEILRVRPVLNAILARIELDAEMYYKMRDVLLSDDITADAPGLKKYLPKGIGFILQIIHCFLISYRILSWILSLERKLYEVLSTGLWRYVPQENLGS